MVSADSELTEIGINQALEAKRGWEAELPFKITLPEKLYSSPLTRALDTLRITFQEITIGDVENKRIVKILEVSSKFQKISAYAKYALLELQRREWCAHLR